MIDPMTTPTPHEMQDRHIAAFSALLQTIRTLRQTSTEPAHSGIAEARAGVVELAVSLAEGMPFTSGLLGEVLRTGSLPVLRALLEDPRNPQWSQSFEARAHVFQTTEKPSDVFDVAKVDVDFLAYVWTKGYRSKRANPALCRRYLTEGSDALDPILQHMSAGWGHPILRAFHEHHEPLIAMSFSGGIRHLKTLEELIRSRPEEMQKILQEHARGRLRERDWPSLALLLRLGIDLTQYADTQSPEVAALFRLSTSAHGRLKLHELEPDLLALAARPIAEPRFGRPYRETTDSLRMPKGWT